MLDLEVVSSILEIDVSGNPAFHYRHDWKVLISGITDCPLMRARFRNIGTLNFK